jgi:hypothetical protein
MSNCLCLTLTHSHSLLHIPVNPFAYNSYPSAFLFDLFSLSLLHTLSLYVPLSFSSAFSLSLSYFLSLCFFPFFCPPFCLSMHPSTYLPIANALPWSLSQQLQAGPHPGATRNPAPRLSRRPGRHRSETAARQMRCVRTGTAQGLPPSTHAHLPAAILANACVARAFSSSCIIAMLFGWHERGRRGGELELDRV